ncbi:MAG: exodeoxyribonuclease V subunit gamma, partial [Deltaproteobacteria bacterium]|nr:exodeoxyribonuclease V subunit gamma [Deltaproteobacteria bacterium]
MRNFRVFTGNRLETLAEALGETLRVPLPSPLEQEIIVVQSRGMERWLSMQLAKQHNVCANIRFPFPNTFIQDIFARVLPEPKVSSAFDQQTMTWRVMKYLPACLSRPEFDSVRSYLGPNPEGIKRLQLSDRIADLFDQYMVFRPDMVFRWEGGKEDHWQALLWREMVKETGGEGHRAARAKAFFKALQTLDSKRLSDPGVLPERVSVFGISALPRLHMEALSAIAQWTEVNLFLMNPCREYWGDILSDREMMRAGSGVVHEHDLHMEKGNSLLASLGTLGREFFDLINEFPSEDAPSFEDPGTDSLLCRIQSDILNLHEGQVNLREGQVNLQESRAGIPGKRAIAAHDRSIRIHSCHSPFRETEVLQDHLLHLFEQDPELMPGDILVMTPDIDAYAPIIQAVFDLPPGNPKGIPFSIADRNVLGEGAVIEPFLALLRLQGSRFGASQVMAILESPAVHAEFGLSEANLGPIRQWILETGIRWGIDQENRRDMGLPPLPQNTWRAGLDRLLLGYAMPGRDGELFEGLLPYDLVEGSDAEVLGGFAAFSHQLFERVLSLGTPRTLVAWSDTLQEMLEAFFMPMDERAREMRIIRQAIAQLREGEDKADFHESVGIDLVRWYLERFLQKEGFGLGFMTGGVTFCAMLPMRSIPFKVICIIGMDDNAYPRESRALSFDLMAMDPRPGDRSRRNDDRNIFLEAILSVRRTLYISYVGQSIQDNRPIPPSVVVSELMDYLDAGFAGQERPLLEQVVTKHRLQAFSPAYFANREDLFSYSEENSRAAESLLGPRNPPPPFITRGLAEPDEKWREVSLEDLCRFFGNPAGFLLNRRLGIRLDEGSAILEEREVFDVKGLDRYLLDQDLLARRLSGGNLREVQSVFQAAGRLPHGTVGECLFQDLGREVERFAEKIVPYRESKERDPLEVDLEIAEYRLKGRIDGILEDRLLHYRYARARPQDHIRAWIHHLVLNLLVPSRPVEEYPGTTMLAGLEKKGRADREWKAWTFAPLAEGEKILTVLMDIYWKGLVRPLPFFPRTS